MPKSKSGSSSFYVTEETGSSNSSPGSTGFNDTSSQHTISNKENDPKISQQKFEKAGWLQKWTNYVKGYRQRWFVLDSDGNLRYYRNSTEVNGSSRGSINLAEASIHCSQSERSNLVITSPASPTLHFKASNEIERQKWLKAMEYAKHRAIRQASALEDDEDESQQFLAKTDDLRQLPTRDFEEMCSSLQELSTRFGKELDGFAHYAIGHLAPREAKKCAEKVEPVRELADSVVKSSQEALRSCRREYEALSRLAHSQNEKYRELQKQYEILAKQHSQLEREAFNSLKSPVGNEQLQQQQEINQSMPFAAEESDDEQQQTSEAVEVLEEVDDDEEQFHDATDNLETQLFGAGPGSTRSRREKAGEEESASSNHLQEEENGGGGDDDNCSKSSSSCQEVSTSSGGGRGKAAMPINSKSKGSGSSICGRNENSKQQRLLVGSNGKLDLSKCSIQMPPHMANYQESTEPTTLPSAGPPKNRRDTMPPKPDSHGLNLWSIMRNCIGKELTRIPLPVNFNEPLSMLQRITEDFEYSYLLDRAAEKEDICERLAYVGAFAISCYSSTAKRTTKPFNPLLGETFEFDRRDDLGWRSLTEQVSHHPPAAAHHVDGVNWVTHQEFMVSSHFRGKYLSVVPTGHTHVDFKDGKAACSFQKITTTVHNIIVGKLWIDNHGEMTIVNHVSGERALIKFHAYSYFSSSRPRKVEGIVLNARGEPRFYIEGYWDNYLNIAPIIVGGGGQRMESGKMVIRTGEARRVWTVRQPIGDASMYNFTRLAITLNEPDEAVAPTDSRRRPDQRLMEDGRWDEANKLKNRLEDKQRRVRRQAEAEAERAMANNQQPSEYRARWFQKVQEPNTGSVIHMIVNDEYWKCKESQDWSRCPDIFGE